MLFSDCGGHGVRNGRVRVRNRHGGDHSRGLKGNEIEVFDKAYRLGEVSYAISRRPVTESEARAVFKVGPGNIITLK